MEDFDVIVIGAGLAGLYCSWCLAKRGLRVLLADRKAAVDTSIRTTGIFVRKTLEDFALPEDCLGPVIRHVTLYSPSRRSLSLESAHDEFRVAKMPLLYARLLHKAICSGVQWLPASRYVDQTNTTGTPIVRFESDGRVKAISTRYVVGADGAVSRVAEDLCLDINSEWIVGVEEVIAGIPLEGPPTLHCFLDPLMAPGYLAWFVHDGEAVHLGVGGYTTRFDPATALNSFRSSLNHKFDFRDARVMGRRGGRIPVNGILRRIANAKGLLIGDAAGAVSPLTAGGFDACLRLSSLAASVIESYLASSDRGVLDAYSGDHFRARFTSRLWMRRLIAGIRQRWLVEAAFTCLQLPVFSAIAWHIFFGRQSFPDVLTTTEEWPLRITSRGVGM